MVNETGPSRGFDTALEHLTGEILAGRVTADGMFPSERELAEQLDVSRGAVREAIKVLQAQGIVTSQVGMRGGTRVVGSQGIALGRILRLHVALRAVSFSELTDTRVVLERAATTAAAGSASTADLEPLETLCDEMEEELTSGRFNELDTAFHVGIARIADNRLIRDLTIAIREAVASPILEAEERLPDWHSFRLRLMQEHRDILAALRSGDAALAADLAEAHVRGAHARLLPD